MANSVLLQAGAYSKFAQSKTASQTSNVYTLLNTMMQECDDITEENLKQLFYAWNTFIENEYPDEKEKWQINFNVTNTTQSNITESIDYSYWISKKDEQTSMFEEVELLEKRIKKLENEQN